MNEAAEWISDTWNSLKGASTHSLQEDRGAAHTRVQMHLWGFRTAVFYDITLYFWEEIALYPMAGGWNR